MTGAPGGVGVTKGMAAARRRLRQLRRQLEGGRPAAPAAGGGEGGAAAAAAAADELLAQHAPPAGPGCAVCVVRAGATLYAAGSGMASLEHGVPITPQTVFDVGSVSKQFTAAAVARLAVEGRLSLEDAVAKHIPAFPDYGSPLTISHLLHHTSGVRDYLTTMQLAGLRAENVYTEAELVEMICRQKKLNFAPGDEHLYSNAGYILLAKIVRAVTGESLGDFSAHALFERASMDRSFIYEDRTRVIADRAQGYTTDSAAPSGFAVDTMWNFDVAGDGQVYTTVEDLCRWDQRFMNGSEAGQFIDMMHERGVLNSGETIDYALGISHGEYGPLSYRTAARTLFLRPYLAHFCSSFRRFFAVLSVLTPGFQKVAPRDRGPVAQRSETAEERVVAADLFLMDRYRGAATVSHGGAWGGFRANLCRYPQQQLSVAVACNLVSHRPPATCRLDAQAED
eukprot:COSAG04_NODE_340_length_16315_cov_1278.534410_9_plen_453_part_00